MVNKTILKKSSNKISIAPKENRLAINIKCNYTTTTDIFKKKILF